MFCAILAHSKKAKMHKNSFRTGTPLQEFLKVCEEPVKAEKEIFTDDAKDIYIAAQRWRFEKMVSAIYECRGSHTDSKIEVRLQNFSFFIFWIWEKSRGASDLSRGVSFDVGRVDLNPLPVEQTPGKA